VQEFIPGQRWISHAESQLGLGTVLEVAQRTVTVVFMASGETRTYAKQSAPLSRALFGVGDTVSSHQGWKLKIQSLSETDGLFSYRGIDEQGEAALLLETELDNFIQLNRPTERLFNGQVDADKWFELRYQCLQHNNRLCHSELRGLTGGRTSLLPHQLYIAHEVAGRYAPRVLLADEVGLGKTIEAGLILHHQLLTERARRVLILVPESLLHQWLVEMLRRFNLYFSIFDEARCLAIAEDSGDENPFHTAQLVLCSLEFLNGENHRLQQCLQGDWDLLVVDEAHHLQWSPQQPSPEYQMVEQLAAGTRGVLLLTATPEQLGKQSHFARLRLLDPDRFPDFDRFVEEEKSYQPVAHGVHALLHQKALDDASQQLLHSTLQETDNQRLLEQLKQDPDDENARLQLVDHLLDRHGTGRVLFRNTRSAIRGFPQRQLHSYPLSLPEAYQDCLQEFQTLGLADPQLLLCPELLYQACAGEQQQPWTRMDPRIDCLLDIIDRHSDDKILLITASADSALDIAHWLKTRTGIATSVFHEGLSIVERDRAAAYFADPVDGAQLLICSEIGSEGRNFQFAHHLVLFDLPLNPDLLEQRIGRLDRIGQHHSIQIHVPYLQNSAQHIMLDWYHQGLDAFEHTCPAGHSVFVQVRDTLIEALHQLDINDDELADLIATTRGLHEQLKLALHQGRDPLLEYNSCRPHIASRLQQEALNQDRHSYLGEFMENIYDCYAIDYEIYRDKSFIIRPGDHMIASFPGLAENGMAITYDRETALANEDLHFITWEHPLVATALDMVLSHEQGNSALTAISYKHAKPGSLLVECLFVLEAAEVEALQSNRYLPPTPLRLVIDEDGTDHSDTLPHAFIKQAQTRVDADTAAKVIGARQVQLRNMVKHSEQLAQQQAPDILQAAHRHSEQVLQGEIDRLQALASINPNIRQEEIDFFQQQLAALNRLLDSAALRLDAVRVIVTI